MYGDFVSTVLLVDNPLGFTIISYVCYDSAPWPQGDVILAAEIDLKILDDCIDCIDTYCDTYL